MRDAPDRGQAFTLEGFVASVVVLTAILLALQSVVLTPTTGGNVDQAVQQQLRTQAHDILVVAAGNGSDCQPSVSNCSEDDSQDLSYLLRYWNSSSATKRTWAGGVNDRRGYGSDEPRKLNDTVFGSALNATFGQRGYNYNVLVEYRNASAPERSETLRLVYRGVPSNDAITTTYTVTLFDNQTLTGPTNASTLAGPCTDVPLEAINSSENTPADECFYPIPEASRFDDDNTPDPETGETSDSPIYNVVEIRVIVW